MNTTDDALPYEDCVNNSSHTAIDLEYELAPLPGGQTGMIYAFPGMFLNAKGKGQVTATSYGPNHAVSQQWSKPLILQVNPGTEFWRQFYIKGEWCTTKFVCGQQPGDYMILSGIRQKYYEWAQRR